VGDGFRCSSLLVLLVLGENAGEDGVMVDRWRKRYLGRKSQGS
jgi:hypothetical protein